MAKIIFENLLVDDRLKKGEGKMTITDIKVRKLIPTGRLKGVISVTFDGAFAVHDIKIVQGDNRLFVAMPSRRDTSGVFRDIVHPISSDVRRDIEDKILKAYEEECKKTENTLDS